MKAKTRDTLRRAWRFTRRAHHFLRNDIWLLQSKHVPRHWWAVRAYRFCGSILFAFRTHRFALHASALTYYTLMSIVPVLALALTLARAFGGDDMARDRVLANLDVWLNKFQPDPAAAVEAVEPAAAAAGGIAEQIRGIAVDLFDQIGQFSFKTLGGIGAVALILMVITLLGRIEESFNMIWGVKQTRGIWRKFSDYLSVVILFPFFLLAAATVPILELATRTTENVAILGPWMQVLVNAAWMKHLLIVAAITLGFTFVQAFMPNTRVKVGAGLLGGFVTGVFFMGWLVICARLQIGIAKYSPLYGGFAMLPILLLWIYTSWLIVLLGAELAFAVQNGDTCHFDFQRGVSPRARFVLCAALCREAGVRVRDASAPFLPVEFAQRHGISVRFTMHVVGDLARNNWLAKVGDNGEAYLPCRDFATLRVADLAAWLFNEGYSPGALGLDDLDATLLDAGARIHDALARELQAPLLGS